MSAGVAWAILTGEYPPQLGGVADYTRQVAIALAREGDQVDVWAPSAAGAPLQRDDRVAVHALPDVYGPRSLVQLTRELATRRGVRVLVQYVPQAFGMRAMNVPFCAWLARRPEPLWVMFHEVTVGLRRGAPLKHNALGLAQNGMAAILARRADRLFVSTPVWTDSLRRIARIRRDPVWLPIPSSLPARPSSDVVARARERLGIGAGDAVVGSFGTFGPLITPILGEALVLLLERHRSVVALLMGRGSVAFADRDLRSRVDPRRVVATGELAPEELAALVAGSSLTVQPYPDGVTTRRTTVMASLSLGVPVVTNEGALSEPFWRDEDAVALAPSASSRAMAELAGSLLADDARRAALGARGRALYERRFAIDNTVRALHALHAEAT